VISTLRYAQKAAISQRRFVCVAFGTNSVTVTYDPTAPSASYTATTCAATNNMTSPLGTSPLTVTSSNATLSGGTTFYFDALGRPFPAQSITVSGYSTSITVAAETGYVY
jgi:MSHA pilin protein MshC